MSTLRDGLLLPGRPRGVTASGFLLSFITICSAALVFIHTPVIILISLFLRPVLVSSHFVAATSDISPELPSFRPWLHRGRNSDYQYKGYLCYPAVLDGSPAL